MLNSLFGSSSRNFDLGREIAALRADLSDVADRVSRVAGAARGELSQGMSTLGDARTRLSETTHGLIGQGRDWLSSAEGELSHGMKHARATVERNPLTGIAVAAAIGFLIGLSARRR